MGMSKDQVQEVVELVYEGLSDWTGQQVARHLTDWELTSRIHGCPRSYTRGINDFEISVIIELLRSWEDRR